MIEYSEVTVVVSWIVFILLSLGLLFRNRIFRLFKKESE
ncbi:hypothetical protein BH23THE1_BH23THE1_23230 [soil metagenome]